MGCLHDRGDSCSSQWKTRKRERNLEPLIGSIPFGKKKIARPPGWSARFSEFIPSRETKSRIKTEIKRAGELSIR